MHEEDGIGKTRNTGTNENPRIRNGTMMHKTHPATKKTLNTSDWSSINNGS